MRPVQNRTNEECFTMRQVLPFKLMLLTLGLLAACVTVNVYFPAAAVEQAADKHIDTIKSGAGSAQPPQSSTQEETKSGNPIANMASARPGMMLLAGRMLEMLIPAAHAQANLDVSTPEIRAIVQSMSARFGQLRKYFDSGAVGLTADGLIAVRDQNAIPLAERATVTRLVAEDNRDRAALYAEIAKANGHPEWEPEIRNTYARRWVERGAEKGWYYQNANGAWVQK